MLNPSVKAIVVPSGTIVQPASTDLQFQCWVERQLAFTSLYTYTSLLDTGLSIILKGCREMRRGYPSLFCWGGVVEMVLVCHMKF